jgi:DNA-binding NarL/FixJ family response regulator
MKPIKTLLCGQRESPLQLLRPLLLSRADVALVGEATSESDTVRLAREWQPDVLLLDASLGVNDIVTLSRVHASSPRTRVLTFASNVSDPFLVRALRHGASGCLRIGTSLSDVLCAMRAVNAGVLWAPRRVVSQAFRELLAEHSAPLEADTDGRAQLSPRQLEIVSWMRHGMTNKEIARRLGISDMTVKTHAHNIFHKLEISGRMHLFGLPQAQQSAVPLEPRSPEIPLQTIQILRNPPQRRARRLNGDGRTAARVTAEDHPPEPAAA